MCCASDSAQANAGLHTYRASETTPRRAGYWPYPLSVTGVALVTTCVVVQHGVGCLRNREYEV